VTMYTNRDQRKAMLDKAKRDHDTELACMLADIEELTALLSEVRPLLDAGALRAKVERVTKV